MAAAPQTLQIDERTMGVNEVRHQNVRYHVEAGDMGAGDTLEVVWQDSEQEGGLPPSGLEIYLHDGGFTAGGGTYADADGDTLVLSFHDPDLDDRCNQCDPVPLFLDVTHTLDGVTGGAATDAQVVASLNADLEFRKYGHAGLVSGAVTIFPIGANAVVKVGEGSTANALAAAFPTTASDNGTRTFARQDIVAAAWTASYAAATKTYTITSVAASEKVHVVVTFG